MSPICWLPRFSTFDGSSLFCSACAVADQMMPSSGLGVTCSASASFLLVTLAALSSSRVLRVPLLSNIMWLSFELRLNHFWFLGYTYKHLRMHYVCKVVGSCCVAQELSSGSVMTPRVGGGRRGSRGRGYTCTYR